MVDRHVLDSWKEIAAYLDRSIRTCQRLERELGLPIHRLEETPKARVFAYQDEIDRWIRRSQHSEGGGLLGSLNLKKLIIPVSVSVFLITVALVIWQLLSPKITKPASIPAERTSVAVVYFKNNTGDENLEHWRRALCELLIYDLAQSRYIDVLPEDRLFDIMKDLGLPETDDYAPEDLEQIADRGKITNIIYGNFARAGDNFRISASIRDFEAGEDMHLRTSEGKGEESLFAMVDELTARIKESLEFSTEQLASDIDRRIEDISTSSPEAMKYYSAGRKHHVGGRPFEAIPLLEKAIEIDPQFALAYRRMGSVYFNIGQGATSREYQQKAFELRDRVADRERFFIEHSYYISSEQTYEQAVANAEKWHALYPGSFNPNAAMGAIYWLTGEWEKSLKYHESAYRISGKELNVGNMIAALEGNGRYEDAEQIYKESLRSQPNSISKMFHWIPGSHFFLTENYDYALEEAERDLLMNPSSPLPILFKADTYHLKGDLAEAEREYLHLLDIAEDKRVEIEARKRLSSLYLQQGKFGAAKDVLEVVAEREELQAAGLQKGVVNFVDLLAHAYTRTDEIEKALAALDFLMDRSVLDPDPIFFHRIALWGKGKAYRKLRSIDDLRQISEELNKTSKPVMNEIGRWYITHINGLLALEEGHLSRAVELFEEVISLLPYETINLEYIPHAVFLESLAFAHYRAGDLEKAGIAYERIASLTMGRLFYGDIYAESFYMLGRIYDQQGETTAAIEQYEKFLELWKDADPGLPEVTDARERVAELRELNP